jgi:voltage-gated potassium channel
MPRRHHFKSRDRLMGGAAALCALVLVGSLSYWLLTGHPWLDCVYMTVITITTVGFGEIIDLSQVPLGRVLTMFIALCGVGILTYMLSVLTAVIVEGELTETFRRSAMEKRARALRGHYIVCGAGSVGFHILSELAASQRPCVLVDTQLEALKEAADTFKDLIYLDGDATDDQVLLAAGLATARGLFAATSDDNQNLVVTLTARQLNPQVEIVARCRDARNVAKLRAAGASHVVSTSLIGGMRMASEMVRPTVVSFLDTMLHDRDKNLRVEEIATARHGCTVTELGLERFPETLLLAVRDPAGWVYNPPRDHVLAPQSCLIVMTTPEERRELEAEFAAKTAS